MPSRYMINDPSSAQSQVMGNLREKMNMIGQVLIDKKMKEQKRQQEMADAIELYKQKKKAELEFDPTLKTLESLGLRGSATTQDVESPAQIGKLQGNTQQSGKLGGFKPKGFTLGGVQFEREPSDEETQRDIDVKVKTKIAEEATKGLPIETGGKLAMVRQAKKDIKEVRDMLFPEGTAKSFKRGLAFASNLPGSRAPLLGAVIPQALPFHEKGQKIYSRLQNAVAAKLRVETGAQANPSEVENILRRFGITSASDPSAAFDALKRLENFMDETINITDPQGRFGSEDTSQDGFSVTPNGNKYKILQ